MKKEHIQFIQKISNPSLRGRVPGTKGHVVARNLILEQFEKLSLTPLIDKKWEQTYTAFNGQVGRNLLAQKKGCGKKWLLLGAHYDHIPGCPGANDNAASVGILLSVLNSLKTTELNINIVLAIFDMEEARYFMTKSMGSIQFYQQSQKILDYDQFLGAFILDLCGHNVLIKNRENSLFVIGANTSPILSQSIEFAQGNIKGLQVYRLSSRELYYLSDHYIFDINQQPHLFFTCGPYANMHTPEDTFEKLNLVKISSIVSLIKQSILNIDSRPPFEKYQPFNHSSEEAELGRFLGVELGPNHNLDHICHVLMREQSKGQKIDLEKIRLMMKALRIL